MQTLWLDTETFNERDIKTCGTHAYAETAEIILVSYAWNDDPAVTIDTSGPGEWEAFKPRLQTMIDLADEVVFHKSEFDRTVLRHRGITIPVEMIEDTMVVALQHSLPAPLDALCGALGVPTDQAKDKAGKKLIQLLCKPRPKNMKLRRATRDTHPVEWAAFKEYARLDIEAMRACRKRMPRWNLTPTERKLWELDQVINDRGVAADLELAHAATAAWGRATKSLAARAHQLTGGKVTSLTQRDKFKEHMAQDHGLELEDTTKGTIGTLLREGTITDEVRELLEVRQQSAATSPAKYKVIVRSVSSDGRLRAMVQFCGAGRTGRDAGRTVQLQNLPRPTLPPHVINIGVEAIKLGCEDLIFDNPSELCINAVRGCLIAPPGKKLSVSDLSNIEGRVGAWLAGEDWKLKAFNDFDNGTGHDLYALAYAKSFNTTPEAVIDNKKNGDGQMRQIGKVQELSLQYQGSVGAYVTMGANYGVNPYALAEIVRGIASPQVWKDTEDKYTKQWSAGLPKDTWTGIKIIVDAWRKAHPRIVSMWYDIEDAARSAIRNPDESFEVRGLIFDLKDGYLRIKLPGGRYLSYKDAQIGRPCDLCLGEKVMPAPEAPETKIDCWECGGTGLADTNIRYMGVDQFTKQWKLIESYGGKFFENIVQAVARDVFMGGMRRAEENGYEVVVRVHDELVTEVGANDNERTHEGLSALMAQGERWTVGLPLAAAGHDMFRYAKGD